MKTLYSLIVLIQFSFILPQNNNFAADFWKKIDLQNRTVLSMAEDSKGNIYMATLSRNNESGRGIFMSTDNGETWVYVGINHIPENVISIKVGKDDAIYAGIHNTIGDRGYGGAFRSDDYGKTWNNINDGLLTNLNDYPSVFDFEFSQNGDLYAICDLFGIVKSTNKGKNWSIKRFPEYFSILKNRASITCNSNNQIIASCDYGVFLYDIMIDTNIILYEDTLQRTEVLDISLNSKNWIFVATVFDSSFYSTNNGQTWQALLYDGHGMYCSFLKIDSHDILYAGLYESYFPLKFKFIKSSDDGLSWFNMNYEIPDTIVLKDIFISSLGYIFLPTPTYGFGNIMYRSQNPIVGVEENIIPIGSIQISPSPATDYIEISNINPMLQHGEGIPEVRIYDIYGRNNPAPPRPTSEGIRIDVSFLPAGIYFVMMGDKVFKFIKL